MRNPKLGGLELFGDKSFLVVLIDQLRLTLIKVSILRRWQYDEDNEGGGDRYFEMCI
jgi:hypothetical protein